MTIRLKKVLLECGITLNDFTEMVPWSRGTNKKVLNGYLPVDANRYKEDIEGAVRGAAVIFGYLERNGIDFSDLWETIPDLKRFQKTVSHGQKVSGGMNSHAMVPGDPLQLKSHEETLMITGRALKHFKMFRSPFINEISDPRDIFMSEEHRFLKEMMLDAARFAGFVAVFGEVGSGKSVMRKAVVQDLVSEGIKVVYPVIIDKSKITPSSLIDAIIMDISEESPKRALEQKTRQALRLLKNRATSGMKQVLMIEEAHLLNVGAMKALKQIYELEDGFNRLVGIILIGQPELKGLLDETQHQEMREVIRRITKAEIAGLDQELESYIEHKFRRINKKTGDIFADDAVQAMTQRLQAYSGSGKKVSTSFPLTVNNLIARAMNLAAEMGEKYVTGELVMSC